MSVPFGSSIRGSRSDPFGTDLTGAELESFNAGISAHPEIRKRDRVDQLTLLRDAQSKVLVRRPKLVIDDAKS